MKKIGILFGGKSAEHEISLLSAKNVYEAIDRTKFEPVLVGIDKKGRWLFNDARECLLNADDPSHVSLSPDGKSVALRAGDNGFFYAENAGNIGLDAVFPILHGPFGEDGTIQGFLKLADIPYVGPAVLGSAVGMDKDVMKRLLREAGVPVGKFLILKNHEKPPSFAEVQAALAPEKERNSPFFIKPANMGSSVGISKVRNEAEYVCALKEAFLYDTKAVMEEYISGREIECAVLGNEEPRASVPGEIIPAYEFYSYKAKYLDDKGAALEIPAKLDDQTVRRVQELSVKVFRTLCCEGLARVDFFLRGTSELIVNEINTMPGFTRISMYPKLWEASGIGYTELITRLIELAVSRFEKERQLKTSVV